MIVLWAIGIAIIACAGSMAVLFVILAIAGIVDRITPDRDDYPHEYRGGGE